MSILPPKDFDRFLSATNKTASCWNWMGAKWNSGYGRFSLRGKSYTAHRISYEEFKGEIPEGLRVCHRCDVKECVNPDHLFLGTDKDNHDDMVAKGRNRLSPVSRKGEGNPASRLSDEKVREIVEMSASGVRNSLIARHYNISTASISDILNGRTWKHVTQQADLAIHLRERPPLSLGPKAMARKAWKENLTQSEKARIGQLERRSLRLRAAAKRNADAMARIRDHVVARTMGDCHGQ